MAALTETAVANRALQRCGADRIDGLLRTEQSRNAREALQAYDISRRTELRRNVWRFSIRTHVLRALDVDTMRLAFPEWGTGPSYKTNDVVSRDGLLWQAKSDNVNSDPILRDFTKWDAYFGGRVADLYSATVAYMAGEIVYSGSEVYISVINNNSGNLLSNTSFWQRFTVDPTLSLVRFIYPIGVGPSSNTQTKNVYMMPNNFMRAAPQDPKQGSYAFLGAPSASAYLDWNFENDYFTSTNPGPIAFRFAADVPNPDDWDPMFLDGFTCRLAIDICEILTQSTTKLGAIGNAYLKFMSEARAVNGIETGPVEAPEDSYITSRY